jgi:hypothetical protein
MDLFIGFRDQVDTQMKEMSKGQLYRVDISKDELWDTYLNSFPEGTNPMFKERTEHDCNCCKSFIRAVGNAVSIVDGLIVTIWDIKVDSFYQEVADAMGALVRSRAIANTFLHREKKVGHTVSHVQVSGAGLISWSHFHHVLDKRFVKADGDSIASTLSDTRANKEVLMRSLEEITLSSADVILELIDQKSIYRGDEHRRTVETFAKFKREYDKLAEDKRDTFCWEKSTVLGGASRIKNTVIGTLLSDISEGVELDKAVKSFEAKVAPANYKRPTALITKGMIKKAQDKVQELGIESSLQRRYAVTSDLTINNVLFADRSAKQEMNVFDDLMKAAPQGTKSLNKVEEVDIETFINTILPKAESLEVMMENNHVGNLFSLIAPEDKEAKNIFKWGNNFSWSYNGEVADSMRERVKAAGGRVDGVLRFTHTWNYDGKNQSLMDLHVFMPGCPHKEGTHDGYGSGRRVGWNNRNDITSGGVQDVDFVNPPGKSVPIENITFPTLNKMPEGKYVFKIHNWQFRNTTTSGFKAEIEVGGEVYSYEYPKALKNKEWVTVAEATLKNGQFTIKHMLPESTSSQEIWGINTKTFQRVDMVLNSPNHWDGEETGNKHYFFALEGCKNEETSRGFYNEFLNEGLTEHRKVFEVLGSKMRVQPSNEQLSGLGFSSTQKNSILCKVSGAFNRTIKINF